MRIVARGCSISIVATWSGPIRRPVAPSTRIDTLPSDSASGDGAHEACLGGDEPGGECDDDEKQDRESREQPSNPLSRRPSHLRTPA